MSVRPQFLYHGTSGEIANQILEHGFKTRAQHRKQSNWKHSIESNPQTIYLTDAYAPYFAINATEVPEHGTPEWEAGGYEAAVIQIDVSKLDQNLLVPDEDVLEQSGRKRDGVKGDMKQRTRHYRSRIKNYIGSEAWLASLEAMGTVGHMGSIPLEAVSRVAYWDMRKAPRFTFNNMDAMISLANYRFVGDKYRNYTRMLFDIPLEPDELTIGPKDYFLQMQVAQAAMAEELKAAKRIVEVNL